MVCLVRVAIDGTKMAGFASRAKSVRYDRIVAEEGASNGAHDAAKVAEESAVAGQR